MSQLEWTLTARDELQEVYDLVARDSIAAADRLVDRIIAAGERVALFPESGRVVPEFGRTDVREVIVAPYRLVYRVVDADLVHVLPVWHASRLMPGFL